VIEKFENDLAAILLLGLVIFPRPGDIDTRALERNDRKMEVEYSQTGYHDTRVFYFDTKIKFIDEVAR
jgi:hypothetical protein